MKAVILLASPSKNLYPFTESIPKSLINVAGKTILENLLEQIKSAGITDVIFVVNYQQEKIFDAFKYGNRHGLKIKYAEQKKILGIGHAVYTAKEHLEGEKSFLLIYGDILTQAAQFEKLLNVYQTNPAKSIAAVSHSPVMGSFNPVYINSTMNITKIEAESESKQQSNYISAGAFILKSDIFKTLPENDYDLLKCLGNLIESSQLMACLWEDLWIDIYYPWDILSANKMLMNTWDHSSISMSTNIEEGVYIKGPVVIGDNVSIYSGTVINGPCFIGSNTFIGNNVLIRPYANIGPDSFVGYGTEIKNSTIFGNSKIGRLSFIGDSVVGEHVSLGSYSMTVNYNTLKDNVYFKGSNSTNVPFKKLGAFIGDYAQIGSNHSIQPGLTIPPHFQIPDNITVNQDTILSYKDNN